LGAQRSQVVRMVVGQGVAIGIWGIATGLGAAYGLTRLMASLLYGVAPNDPAIFAATAGFLFAVVGVASWIPGFRAALSDPAVTLRSG
jgi:putative ABC transport system permease protein